MPAVFSNPLVSEIAAGAPSAPIAWTCHTYLPAASDETSICGSVTVVSTAGAANVASGATWTRYEAAPRTGYHASVLSAASTSAPSMGRRTATAGSGLGAPGVADAGGYGTQSVG